MTHTQPGKCILSGWLHIQWNLPIKTSQNSPRGHGNSQIVYSDCWSIHTNQINTCKGSACPGFFLAPFWMQTSRFISHLFINRTFHRQTKYTFEYRNMSLVANHSNNQSQLITEWKKGKEMAAPPFPIPVLPSIWDGHWHIYVVHTYLGCSFCLFSGAA